MLARIRIRDLGVIDDVEVDLAPGLNVLTGETGAGKTMVVTGLGLLLGARGDAGVVRAGADSCVVEGIVEVGPGHPARARVAEAGGDAADDLVLARSVSAAGRSRAYVGGRAAPVGVLAEVGEMLVALHGQADQWRLRQPEQHREMLDEFGGASLASALVDYRHWYRRLGELSAELARVRQLERDRMLESQVLVSGLEEIEAVAPLPGEDVALRDEDERLGHADSLRMAAGAAHDLLTGADEAIGATDDGGRSVAETIARVRSELASASVHDPALAQLEPRIAEVGYLVAELGADLGAYLADLESDPARLGWVQARRAELARLTRKFGDSCDDVLAWGERAAARLAELDGATARLGEIEAETSRARREAGVAADRLHAERLRAATELGDAVTAELAHLAMGRAVVDVQVSTAAAGDGLELPSLRGTGGQHGHGGADAAPVAFGPHGVDAVEIRLAANPGAPARSVAKTASGGELSRVMLALEVVTGHPRATPAGGGLSPATESATGPASNTAPTGGAGEHGTALTTFVFDEVDAGVGGRAALDVGARLAALAQHAQVVVVTHLAQVAAFADRHLVVRKADDGHVTSSGVEPVEGDAQLAELARMMAGSASHTALQHAAELRAQAMHLRGSG